MRQELIELKQYLLKKGIKREAYAIDTLPRFKGIVFTTQRVILRSFTSNEG